MRALRRVWVRECQRAGILPGSAADGQALLTATKRFHPLDRYLDAGVDVASLAAMSESEVDTSEANGSSIVLLVEHAGHAVLLAADSTPSALIAGLERLTAERHVNRLDLDAFKLPHHGSRHNVVRDVLQLVSSQSFLVSTDGSYYGHPDKAAIARVITSSTPGAQLIFNYRTPESLVWADAALIAAHGYHCVLPEPQASGVELRLL